MSVESVKELAEEIGRQSSSPGDVTYLRRAVVTAAGTTTATITMGGVTVAAVPYYDHLSLSAGDIVDVLFDGPAPRIIGAVGGTPPALAPSLPATRLYTATLNGVAPATYTAFYDFFTQNSVAVVPVACTMDVEVMFWSGFSPAASYLELQVHDEAGANITHGMSALSVTQPQSAYIPGAMRGTKTYAANATAGFRLAWHLSASSTYLNASIKVSFRL